MSRRYEDYDEDRYSTDVRRRNVRAEVATQVLIPATSLLVMSALSFLGLVCLLVFLVIMLFVEPPKNKPDDIMGVIFAFGGTGVMLVFKGIVALGAIPMVRMRMYPLALTAAIVQVIPCGPCWVFDMPVGIWALIILLMPDVRAAFYADDA